MIYYKKQLACVSGRDGARPAGPSPMQIKLRPRPTGRGSESCSYRVQHPVVDADPLATTMVSRPMMGTDWSLGTPSR